MEGFWKRAAAEVLLGAVAATALSLFSVALFAVFVRAFAPADAAVIAINGAIKCLAAFIGALIFVRRERSLLKGIAEGLCALLFTALVFGAIGGFHFSPIFLAEVFLCALSGGIGALLGGKLRKD